MTGHAGYSPCLMLRFLDMCSAKKLGDLLSYAQVKPAVNQVESHPYWRNEKTIEFCKSHVRPSPGVSVLKYPARGLSISCC